VGYEYYGSQLGTYMQWPGIDWCPTTYDPRFRPWFAAGAAGPKDVVIVIDTSGSMRGNRISMAEEAAKRVVDTLTEADYAAVVTFSFDYSTKSNSLTLQQMTTAAKADAKAWISSNTAASGGTDYVAAFAKVWQILGASSASTSFCNRVVLFLSDGVPTTWDPGHYTSVQAAATLHNAHVLTYGLGSGADATVLKRLACENAGVYYSVSDTDNLADVMAAYYKILSPMIEPCQVRFIEYEDWFTKKRLLGACVAAYSKADPSAPSTCSATNAPITVVTDVPHLIGVACLDMSLMASNESLRANAGWADFQAAINSARQACPRRTLSASALEQLRTAVGPDAVCASASASALSTSSSYMSRTSLLEMCASGYPHGTDVGSSGGSGGSSSGGGSSAAGLILGVVVGAVAMVALGCCMYTQGKAQGQRSAAANSSSSAMSTASHSAHATQMPVSHAVPVVSGVPVNDVPMGLRVESA